MAEFWGPPAVGVVALCIVLSYYIFLFSLVPVKRGLSFQARLALFLATSVHGRFMDTMVALASAVSAILYVAESYMLIDDNSAPFWMFSVEVFVSIGFAAHLLLTFYAAHDKLRFMRGMTVWVDIITVVPVLAALVSGRFYISSAETGSRSELLRVLYGGFRVARLFRLFRTTKAFSGATDNAIYH
jgi:hypothetical protein